MQGSDNGVYRYAYSGSRDGSGLAPGRADRTFEYIKPALVAGLNDAASEAPRLESLTRKSEPKEFQTGTFVPAHA